MARLLDALLLPPSGPILLALAGLLLSRRWRRTGCWVFGVSLGVLLLLSLPAVGGALLHGLQRDPALAPDGPVTAGAIVVLSADADPHAPEYGGADLGGWTL